MKSSFRSVLLFLALATGLLAQAPAAKVFRVVSLETVEDSLFYDSKTAAIPLLFQAGSLSAEYPPPAKAARLVIYKLVSAPEGKPPLRVTVAEMDYPSDAARVIVMLYRGRSNPSGLLSSLAVEDVAEQHDIGKVRIINVSAMPVAFAADKTITQVQPYSFDQYAPFPTGPLELQVAVQAGGAWTRVFSLERKLRPNTRLFAIVADAPPAREGAPPAAATIVYEGIVPKQKP